MATTLQEAYKENPLDLQHILPIDFHSVQKVPDSHLWPKINNFPSNVDEKTPNVPIIDLLAPNVVELIGHACKTWGVFQVVNHGFSSKLLDEVESQARRLFALPAEQKVRVLRSAGGATGYGAARITPFFSKFMWHEGFTIMGSPLDHARELWPHDYQYFCSDVMENYQKEMKALAYQLWLLILKYLEASQEDLNSELIGALQLNSYPCCPNPNHAIGLAPHTDSLFLTILHQTSNTKGLQFLKQGHGWTSISPVSDNALIINVGDLLHILSNGEFPTVYHRVLVNQTKHRVSLAYFYGPPADSLVVPLISSKDNIGVVVPRYRSLTVKEYISLKAKHLEKAFSLIRF
ncbi:gibberellin 3-beta-dioxygenase 1-like isoform X1 [Lycium ferocissimum]|uniref:gibberellin 3-beta-dioxygenase 1-like isoform X1 n=1 Tax=Lycium ferocissimum TaxID=112874 RepID=UPI002815083B|nr:gibberellin 3-beta-dioxygenase 1-like isoform X1 [Lycium ferocissimum]